MNVTINEEAKTIPEGLNLVELLKVENVEMPETVSVQINGTFIRQDAYASTPIQENDTIQFLYFMGGGA